MKKVIFIVSTLRKTGPINVLYNIVKNMNREKYQITVVTLSPEVQNKSMLQNFLNLDIEIRQLNLSRLQGYLYGGLKLKKIVDSIKPDIVHASCFRSFLLSALFLYKYYKVATIHCDYDTDFIMSYGKSIGMITKIFTDFSLLFFNKRIAVSQLLSDILNKKKLYKFEYVNNGVDINKFKPVNNKFDIRTKLNLPTNKTIWIWVGCLTHRKNPLLLANAINQINDKNNFYIFCGEGQLKNDLKENLQNMDNVILTGNIDNIEEYLQASDYYVSTSFSEGLPMSVLEGMACGLPCLLSNIKQHTFLNSFNAKSVVLYKSNDLQDFIKQYNQLQKINYEEFSKNARLMVENHFNSCLMAKEYEGIYDCIS